MAINRPLSVFLCHLSKDKPIARDLHKRLQAESWIDAWLDEEKLLQGQDWHTEVRNAVEAADVVLVILSNQSVSAEGYVHRDLKFVLDIADQKRVGEMLILPLRFDDCPIPRRLRNWQYVDHCPLERKGWIFERALGMLRSRAQALDLQFESPLSRVEEKTISDESLDPTPVVPLPGKIILSNGMEFMPVPMGTFLMGSKRGDQNAYDHEKPQYTIDIPYDYWMARFPVTNDLYNIYIESRKMKHPVYGWEKRGNHPVVCIAWENAMDYCLWLRDLLATELPADLTLRLPTESEWEKAARGLDGRAYPWGNSFDKNHCNTTDTGIHDTTPVGLYSPRGNSPYGCADMVGNVWEWTHSLNRKYPYLPMDGRENEISSTARVLRGGSFGSESRNARCAFRLANVMLSLDGYQIGFRVALAPKLFG
jgi:formylglycine-generating enzyme required for sulfatase activity